MMGQNTYTRAERIIGREIQEEEGASLQQRHGGIDHKRDP